MKKYSNILLLSIFFIILSCLLFYKGFLGYSLQGADGTLGWLKLISSGSPDHINIMRNDVWLGNKLALPTSVFTLILNIFNPAMVEWFAFLISVLLSLIFCYLFLRKLNLSVVASLFGSIAYSFVPHFITTIFNSQINQMDMLFYPPAIFFFLSIIFDKTEKDRFKIFLSLILAGTAWGIMMTDDPQRGLYFSIAAACYILYKVIINNEIEIKNIFTILKSRNFLFDAGKVLIILIFLVLAFANGLKSWQATIALRSAQTQYSQTSQEAADAKWKLSTMWSLDPAELIDSFAFGFHGKLTGDQEAPYWGSKEYCGNSEAFGYFTILFSIIGIFAFYRKNNFVKFFFWTGLLTILLSFGKFLPGTPFYWLFYQLPLMKNFRAPVKYVSIASFALAVLSSFGIQYVLNLIDSENERYKKILNNCLKAIAIFLGIGIIWIFFTVLASNDLAFNLGQKLQNQAMGSIAANNMIFSLFRMIIFTLLAFGLLFILFKYKDNVKVKNIIAGTFILLSIIDLLSIDWFYMDKAYFKEKEFYRPDGTVQFLVNENKNDLFRVGTSLMYPANNGQAQSYPVTGLKGYYLTYMFPYYNIQSMDITAISGVITEYDNFFLKSIEGSITKPVKNLDDLIDLNLRLLNLANIKYLILDGMSGNSNILLTNIVKGYDNRDHYIYYNPGYLPRLGFYDNYLTVKSNEDALKYIGDRSIDVRNILILNVTNEERLVSTNAVVPLNSSNYLSWRIKTSFTAPNDGALLFISKYEPDWKAYVDGKKEKIYQANYLEMGIFVTKGLHTVEFKYEPDKIPLSISLFTIILGLLTALVYGIKNLGTIFKTIKSK